MSPRPGHPPQKSGDQVKVPDLEEFLAKRDYQGAIAVLAFKRSANRNDVKVNEMLAYCHFHFGEHDKALHIYRELLAQPDPDPQYHTYAAACHYYMGLYKEAEAAAQQVCTARVPVLPYQDQQRNHAWLSASLRSGRDQGLHGLTL